MSNWISEKTDWTTSDYINYDDLNRVENNTKYVYEQLNAYGYYVATQTHKTDWAMSDIVYKDDLNRIEQNIKDLAQAYYTTSEFETLKTNWATLDSVTYTFANRIEKDLKIINDLIVSMSKDFVYCGVPNCGQTRLWQQRFRRPRRFDSLAYNTLGEFPSSFTLANISTQSDSAESSINEFSSIYGTMLFINNGLNTIDELVGGTNE